MARPKPTEEDLEMRGKRAVEWRVFMKNYLFTESRLAETLGISRRTVQMIKAGKVSPNLNTLKLFESLKAKYNRGRSVA
jgi:DNA-binding XRE family transcriptional regulator